MKLNESTLRDNLAKNITVFFPNLEVIKTEYNIPNVRGTRGSIDILAKDTEGCYVIIELKRSNQAAREAIHEVHKYIEGLKENLKTKDSEIKVYIVSTEWKELIIPFSSFKRDNHFTVEGFLIEINDKFEPTKCELVVPIKLNSNRLFSPIQSCRMYENEANLNKGIKECVYS